MKLTSVRPAVCALSFVAISVASILACGSNSTAGAGNAFVGTWSCPALPAGSRTLVITESPDNSLTLNANSDGGTSDLCPTDQWTFSGSTATMAGGTSCLGGTGLQVVTVNSLSLTTSGSTLTVSGNETVLTGSEEPDGAPTAAHKSQTVTLSGTCKKQ